MKSSKFSAYLRYMDKKGIKYTAIDDRAVRVQYSGDNVNTIAVIVIFDENNSGKTVHFVVTSLAKFNEKKLANGLVVCNTLNQKFRWTKFYIDNDMDLRVEADAIVDDESVGEECAEMVQRIVQISDQAYPEVMKVVWA